MNSTTRREFIKQAGTLGTCFCCIGTSSLLSGCSTTSKISVSATEAEDLLSFPRTAFAEKNYVMVSSKRFGELIYVTKHADGSYSAVKMLCTHKGCGLDVSGDVLLCGCHGSEFSAAGQVLKGPAKSNLESFTVTSDEQTVMIHF